MFIAEKSAIEDAKRCKTDEHDSEDEESDDDETDGLPEDEVNEGMHQQEYELTGVEIRRDSVWR